MIERMMIVENVTREDILKELQESFRSYMDTYHLDDIGLFEEQGPNGSYYMGYTISRNGDTYMIHQTYEENDKGLFSLVSDEWTIETDEPEFNDKKGVGGIDSAFQHLHEE
jgi:hypothetical protein